jgi:WXG100 family type VII secretion target
MPPGNGTFAYDPEDFGAAANALVTATETIDAELNQLELRCQNELDSWRGAASAQYWVHKREWDAAINEMHSMLGMSVAPTVSRISQNYQDNEDLVERSWRSRG